MASVGKGFLLQSESMLCQNTLLVNLKSEPSLTSKSVYDTVFGNFTASAITFPATIYWLSKKGDLFLSQSLFISNPNLTFFYHSILESVGLHLTPVKCFTVFTI